jgi:transposase
LVFQWHKKNPEQPFLEKRMYIKKTVLEVAPVFLKKEKRIEAMLFLYFTALMVVSLIERKIRMNMEKETIEKLSILPQRMNTKKPTWNNIRYFFRNIHYSEIFQNKTCLQTTVKGLSELHEKVLKLLEIPSWIYTNLNDKWWQFKGT